MRVVIVQMEMCRRGSDDTYRDETFVVNLPQFDITTDAQANTLWQHCGQTAWATVEDAMPLVWPN